MAGGREHARAAPETRRRPSRAPGAASRAQVHFGTIYAVFLVGWTGLYAVLNLMSHKGIGFLCTGSVIGYSLLPIVFLASLSIPVEMRGVAGAVFM